MASDVPSDSSCSCPVPATSESGSEASPAPIGDDYLPDVGRSGVGLCLSGGGFRAALFHLGALRRLNELGILPRIRTISSVSGGSIVSAHLARTLKWPLSEPIPGAEWEERVAGPLRGFVSRNLRTLPLLERLLPWNWTRDSTAVEALASRYARHLTKQTLGDLPSSPAFVFCATDMAFGVNWEFRREHMGSYQAGSVTPHRPEWPVARAVAASSCFPPVFNPLPVPFGPADFTGGRYKGPSRDAALRDLRLTDGGNYDNLATEPVWKTHATVLVSDGGGIFDPEPHARVLWKRLQRYAGISDSQARALRKRWLIASYKTGVMNGAYWGIGSARERFGITDGRGFPKAVALEYIATVRTDLDAFSNEEAAALENHGYFVADAAVAVHASGLITARPELVAPHPKWEDARAAQRALADSRRRTILGRW